MEHEMVQFMNDHCIIICLREFCNILLDIPKGTQLEHFIMSKMGEQISPTCHKALNRGVHPYAQA